MGRRSRLWSKVQAKYQKPQRNTVYHSSCLSPSCITLSIPPAPFQSKRRKTPWCSFLNYHQEDRHSPAQPPLACPAVSGKSHWTNSAPLRDAITTDVLDTEPMILSPLGSSKLSPNNEAFKQKGLAYLMPSRLSHLSGQLRYYSLVLSPNPWRLEANTFWFSP